jgi:hypothetical protein
MHEKIQQPRINRNVNCEKEHDESVTMKTFKPVADFVTVIIGNLLFSIMPQSY